MPRRNRIVFLLVGIASVMFRLVVPPDNWLGLLRIEAYGLMENTCMLIGMAVGMGLPWGLLLLIPAVHSWYAGPSELTIGQLWHNVATGITAIAILYWVIALLGGFALGYYVRTGVSRRTGHGAHLPAGDGNQPSQ